MKILKKIKYLSKYTKDSKKYIISYIFLTLLISIIGIILPIIISLELVNLTNNIWNKVILCAITILILSIIRNAIQLIVNFCTEKYSKKIIRNIQFNIAEEILKIKTENIDQKSNGLFIQRLTSDANSIARIFTFGIHNINSLIAELGIFVILYSSNFWIGLYFSIFVIILFTIEKLKVKFLNKLDEKYRNQKEKTSGFATELIRGIRDIKMLNAEKNFMSIIKENINSLNITNYKLNISSSIFWLITDTIYDIFNFLLILMIIFFIREKFITLATGIVIYNYKSYIWNIIYRINSMIDYLRDFNLSFDRIIELFNNKEFSKEQFGSKHLDKINGDFSFQNVEFSYGKNKVLNKINFQIKANETVAFVGKSGVGKTTIFNLLCKLYDCQKGKITIDDIDIQKLDKDSIRGNITVISQNPYIFNMSIRDNLKLVKPDLTDEEMIIACKMACLDEDIETLENKYDTIVGEGGVLLSGGQKQRLAIARAFVQKTEIILFDEATSALDNETQLKIQKSIDNLKKEYTILIIAHRLSTIINCDRILFMEEGKIIAEGTHEQLLKTCKQYQNLYETESIIK